MSFDAGFEIVRGRLATAPFLIAVSVGCGKKLRHRHELKAA
jgi:hypothetical protein